MGSEKVLASKNGHIMVRYTVKLRSNMLRFKNRASYYRSITF